MEKKRREEELDREKQEAAALAEEAGAQAEEVWRMSPVICLHSCLTTAMHRPRQW